MNLTPNPSIKATAHGQRLMSNVGGGVSMKGHKQVWEINEDILNFRG